MTGLGRDARIASDRFHAADSDQTQVDRPHATRRRSDNIALETAYPNETGISLIYSTRALQLAVAVCGLVPVGAGLAGVLLGPNMIHSNADTSTALDSHYRYLSGLLLGIGLGFWTTVPDIGRNGRRFRLLTAIVVIGGIGRLWSLRTVGVPDGPMLFGLFMELIVTPLLALWQYQIATSVLAKSVP